jgi:FkbM family methyltransferase
MQGTVFDVGMYDGADSAYYLEKGFTVIAVEANPELVERARHKFSDAVASGRMILENVAVSDTRAPVQLNLLDDDLGSSTISQELGNKVSSKSVTVDGVRFNDLLQKHGVPHYLKVDIEGCDAICIRALSAAARPNYVSFEMGDDAMELAEHLKSIGYNQFKIISQTSFKQLNQHALAFRLRRKLKKVLGQPDLTHFACENRTFAFGHSSGPMGEATSGAWQSHSEMVRDWQDYTERKAYDVGGWFDLHAKLGS